VVHGCLEIAVGNVKVRKLFYSYNICVMVEGVVWSHLRYFLLIVNLWWWCVLLNLNILYSSLYYALSICLSVCLSVCLSACLSVRPSVRKLVICGHLYFCVQCFVSAFFHWFLLCCLFGVFNNNKKIKKINKKKIIIIFGTVWRQPWNQIFVPTRFGGCTAIQLCFVAGEFFCRQPTGGWPIEFSFLFS